MGGGESGLTWGVDLATFRVALGACDAGACLRCAGSLFRSWMKVHSAPWMQVPLAKNTQ